MDANRAVVTVRRWTEFGAYEAVLASCLADLGGMERLVRPGQVVVIKPNITANARAETGGTTHVELVEALVRQVQRCRPARIVVAEGTGAFGARLETAFPVGGWREMATRTGVELYNLDGGPHIDLPLDSPRYPHPLPFSQLVYECDVFITVPILKTHINCDYSVSLKNSYCLTPQFKRSEIHAQGLLEEALTDLNRIRKPDLTVVDAWEGNEGIAGGAKFDRPAGARMMIVGTDPVALDTISCDLMGLSYRTAYLQWAAEDGVGIGDRARIDVLGDGVTALRKRYMTPAEEIVALTPGFTFRDQGACSRCRNNALGATRRFASQKLLKPVTVVVGGEGEAPEVSGEVIVLGDCAKPFAHLGRYIGGCPGRSAEVIQALEDLGAVCVRCRDLARQAIEGLPDEFLAHLRVTGAGAEVWAGAEVRRDAWHLELLVGNCMARYAHVIRERASQFGLVAERDVIWLEGCPPDRQAVDEALVRLQQAMVAPQG